MIGAPRSHTGGVGKPNFGFHGDWCASPDLFILCIGKNPLKDVCIF